LSWPERLSQLDVDRLLMQLVHYLELAGIALAVVVRSVLRVGRSGCGSGVG
jgi:hypothetical protein